MAPRIHRCALPVGVGYRLGAVRRVALLRLGSGREAWSISGLEGAMATLAPALTFMPPNLSLNPDASPAALARRPLAAG